MKKRFIAALLITLGLLCSWGRSDAATVFVPDDYATIQEAVSGVRPHDIISVRDGEYRENVVINSSVILKSVNGPQAVKVVAEDASRPVFLIEGVTDYALSGFTATGSTSAGIYVKDSSKGYISNNEARGNFNGIVMYGSPENKVTRNSAESNDNYGIYLEKSHRNTLDENNISRNRDRGLFLTYSNGNTITANSANLNMWNGITLWESNGNVIKDNLTLRNTYGIVIGNSRDNELDGNRSLPNIFIILPIMLIYIGILSYLIQKNLLRWLMGT